MNLDRWTDIELVMLPDGIKFKTVEKKISINVFDFSVTLVG